MKRTLGILLMLIGTLSSCKKESVGNKMEFTGKLVKIEASYYQYGTHIITNNNLTYALTSSKITLNDYNNKTVTITASKISGYPLEGGPVYLDVVQVKDVSQP